MALFALAGGIPTSIVGAGALGLGGAGIGALINAIRGKKIINGASTGGAIGLGIGGVGGLGVGALAGNAARLRSIETLGEK